MVSVERNYSRRTGPLYNRANERGEWHCSKLARQRLIASDDATVTSERHGLYILSLGHCWIFIIYFIIYLRTQAVTDHK